MTASEFAARRSALQQRMAAEKLDAFVVGVGPNVRYLTGFTGSNGVMVMLSGGAVFFTDPRYQIQAAQEVDCPVRVASGPLLLQVAALLRRVKSKPAVRRGRRSQRRSALVQYVPPMPGL